MKSLVSAIAFTIATALASSAGIAAELGYKVVSKAAKYEDIRDNLKDAIINRGFVIDYVGQFNQMLERTAEATGSVTEAGRNSLRGQALS